MRKKNPTHPIDKNPGLNPGRVIRVSSLISTTLWNPLLDDYYADNEDQQDSTTTTTSEIESKSRIIQETNSELRQADLVIPGRKVGLHAGQNLHKKWKNVNQHF